MLGANVNARLLLEDVYCIQYTIICNIQEAVEYEWEHWLKQFETLLKGMYWVNATVHLETELSGKHTFHWQADSGSHAPSDAELRMSCEWEREASFAV